jgi:hypothetical protein
MATRGARVRCASRSVCPFHGNPAREKASLFTGAVAIAAKRPAGGARTAGRVAHRVADGLVRGTPGFRRENAALESRARRRSIDLRLADGRDAWILCGFPSNLGPDARWITCGDRDDRSLRVHLAPEAFTVRAAANRRRPSGWHCGRARPTHDRRPRMRACCVARRTTMRASRAAFRDRRWRSSRDPHGLR